MDETKAGFGLALSGGGFRATLFHLGVIRFLYEIGELPKVTHICAVSGGSVLGAHLVLNWSKYTGDDDAFQEATDKLVKFVRADIRGRVVRRWLLNFITHVGFIRRDRWGLTELLQRYFDCFYEGKALCCLGEAGEGASEPPDLHILSTSMSTGDLCSFSKLGFWADLPEGVKDITVDSVPIALAVTASSAFPPLFPPVALPRQMLGASQQQSQGK